MKYEHVSVLAKAAIEGLSIKKDGIYVDATMGAAGHSKKILEALDGSGKLICFDQDLEAIKNAHYLLQDNQNLTIVKNNFRNIDSELDLLGIDAVDGILMDIGVSSPQLDHPDRGFSYNHNARLDMRMDQSSSLTAEIIVNEWTEDKIAKIIRAFGEERFAKRIAKKIIRKRTENRIEMTYDLVEVIKEAIPAANRRKGPHPAKRTFQALRIAVNDELGALEEAIVKSTGLLTSGGRLAIITFHSLEDRIVKKSFRDKLGSCTCPSGFPECICGYEKKFELITRKAITPSVEELEMNPRSRSAKLRIIERL